MFRVHVFIIKMTKLHYTASGIITPIGVIFISVINQLYAQNVCFIIILFHASTCAHHQEVKITSGIITPIGVMIPEDM